MSSSDEALSHEGGHWLGGTVEHLPQARFVAAAQLTLSRLSRVQLVELTESLREAARSQDVNYPGLHEVQSLADPRVLGGLFGHLRLNSPGLLEQLLAATPFYAAVATGMDAAARASE